MGSYATLPACPPFGFCTDLSLTCRLHVCIFVSSVPFSLLVISQYLPCTISGSCFYTPSCEFSPFSSPHFAWAPASVYQQALQQAVRWAWTSMGKHTWCHQGPGPLVFPQSRWVWTIFGYSAQPYWSGNESEWGLSDLILLNIRSHWPLQKCSFGAPERRRAVFKPEANTDMYSKPRDSKRKNNAVPQPTDSEAPKTCWGL